MLKNTFLEIKEKEKTYFARSNSEVRKYSQEIEYFLNHINYTSLTFMNKIRFILFDYIDYYEKTDFKFIFEKHLIRADGKLNSPKLKSVHVKHFEKRIDELYPFLNAYKMRHKWFYIKNNLNEIPKCIKCGKTLYNFDNGRRFCSQYCSATSVEASERTSKFFKGRKLSDEQKQQMSIRHKKKWKSSAFRENIIPKLKEANKGNGKHFLDENGHPWNYGKPTSKETIKKIMQTKKERGVSTRGKNNGQFGKSPSPKAGRGINGRYKKQWFRSSLELFYLMFFDKNGIIFKSAETSEFRVYYNYKGFINTYSPDFYLISEDKIIEIKPSSRIKEKVINVKMCALKEKFGETKCEFRTEKNISPFIELIDKKYLENEINNGNLELTEKQKNRLFDVLKGIKYEYRRHI